VTTSYRLPAPGGALAVAILGLACTHPSEAPRWAHVGQSCPADAPIVELPAILRDSVRRLWAAFRTDDDRWADLAREVPGGFAGMMLEGGLVVFLVDTTQRDAALAALAARGALQGREPKRVRVRKARWDFAQLIDWYHYLNLSAWSDSGEVQSDIDEEHNRISYGVMGASGRRRLERVLAQLRPPPPCFLVAIEVVGPPPEKAVSRVPARLGSDTTRIILPDTVSRGREFPMTVPTFGGGCIRELAPTDVSVHGLRARVTFYHVRRQGAFCLGDRIEFRQTVQLRFDKSGLATIELRGVTNGLEFGDAKPQWVIVERHVVIR